MENVFRNEMEVIVGGEKILLRPTFENMAAMETKLGSVGYLAYKYGAQVDPNSVNNREQVLKVLPPLTEVAQIIYLNQAKEPGMKHRDLEEIFQLCLADGIKVGAQIVLFLVRCTAGNKNAPELTSKQKKN